MRGARDGQGMDVQATFERIEIPPAPAIGPFTEPCRALFAYWKSLPKTGLLPSRADFNPMQLRQYLPYLSIMQFEDGDLKIRLAGTAFRARADFELTGRSFRDLVTAEDFARTMALVPLMFTRPCGSWHIHEEELASRLRYEVEALSLPMIGDTPDAKLIVSATVVLRPNHPMDREHRPAKIYAATRHAFIDIGAGLPDARWVPPAQA